MKYISTRGQVEPITLKDAVMMGLANDGGLLVPQSIPDVSSRLDDWRKLGYAEIAFEVIRLFATDIPDGDLRELISGTYGDAKIFNPSPAPVTAVGDMFFLELWHGPTMSFKDIALQLLGRFFERILSASGGEKRLNILGATSGDTGSAAICGVRGRGGIDIFMMHPAGRISEIQHRQMTTVPDANVHNIAIEGSFDDCQQIMKSLAGDLQFKRACSLGAVNSVNFARVMAQIVYYFSGSFEVRKTTGAESVRVCVPTGNFGDILAGWYAMKMGAPISKLILATNENDILSRFFNTGEYSIGQVHQTPAPAMDIQVASNFERYLYYRTGCDCSALCDMMKELADTGALRVELDRDGVVDPDIEAGSANREDIFAAIRECYERYGYLIDPHTACGLAVANSPAHAGEEPTLCISTAHPAKFPDAILAATGRDVAHHPAIDALKDLPTRCEVLPNDTGAVRDFILRTVG